MAAKKKLNKTAYILKHGSLSAPDLVKKAKGEGIKLTDKYIYNIRAKSKASAGKAKGKPGRPPNKVNGSRRADGSEAQFAMLALDMGLGKAEQLLKDIRAAAANAAN